MPSQEQARPRGVARAAIGCVKRNWTWLKWPATLAVLAWLGFQNRHEFADLAEREIQWRYVAAGLLLCAAATVLTFVRWYLLVVALEFPFTLRDALRLEFISYLFNYVSPGGAGGDLVKAALIAHEQQERRVVAAATVAVDRVLGVLSLFIVAAVATCVSDESARSTAFRPYLIGSWLGAIMGAIALAIALHPAVGRSRWLNRLVHWPRIGRYIGDLLDALRLYQSKRMVLVVAVLIGIAGHFGTLSAFYFAGLSFNAATAIPSYWAHLQFIPMAELFGAVIPLPGGLGAQEGAVAYFYEMWGSNRADGLLTAVAYRALTVVIVAVGAGYYLTARREIREAMDEAHSAPSNSA